MQCENCKKNEANVYLTQIINGKKQELRLCEQCAKELNGFHNEASNSLGSAFTFQSILSGLMDYMSPSQHITKTSDLTCKNCGTTYSEFKKNGLLGCSKCYEEFNISINPVIKKVQGNIEHVGKLPKKMGKEIVEKRRLTKLKEDLQKAIAGEEYEKAAEIRDQIKSLQNNE